MRQMRKRDDSKDATWKYDVFISHAGEQGEFAEELRTNLTSLGIRAFVAQADLKGGDRSEPSMLTAARDAPVGVAYFSSDYFRKVCTSSMHPSCCASPYLLIMVLEKRKRLTHC